VVTVKLPLNAIVPVVSVSVTVTAATVSANVVPPDWVSVTTPISVPTASATFTNPEVLIVRLETAPEAVPVTLSRLIGLAIPVPTVSVAPSTSVASPISIRPVAAPPTKLVAVTATAVLPSPSAIVLVDVFAATVPAILSALGAVATNPAVKVVLSPPALPSVTTPVFKNVVVPAITFADPRIETK